MAQRWHSTFLKDGGEIYRFALSDERYAYGFAHLKPDYYILFEYVSTYEFDDPICAVFDTHFHRAHTGNVTEINEDIFNRLLIATTSDIFYDTLLENDTSNNYPYTPTFAETEAEDTREQRRIKNLINYIETQSLYGARVHIYQNDVVCEFDVMSISHQPYKYVIFSGYRARATQLVVKRGINMYDYKPHFGDILLLEPKLDLASIIIADHVFELLYHEKIHDVAQQKYYVYYLNVRTKAHLEQCLKKYNTVPEHEVILREMFDVTSYEENYARSTEPIFEILKMPRVIFNIILEYL